MANDQADLATSPPPSVPSWTKWHTWSLVLIVVVSGLLGLFAPLHSKLWAWLVTLSLLVAFSAIAGQGITGCWSGLLIDERNLMSLSRLQMVLWTTLVLSGLMTAAISNVATNQTAPLAIAIPQELWILMGISTTTLVATPLVLNPKKTATLSQTEKAQRKETLALIAEQRSSVKNVACGVVSQGKLIGYCWPKCAHLDLSKVQMFYFTLLLVLVYAVALGRMFAASSGRIAAFPDVDASMVALMGISHAGHLVRQVT